MVVKICVMKQLCEHQWTPRRWTQSQSGLYSFTQFHGDCPGAKQGQSDRWLFLHLAEGLSYLRRDPHWKWRGAGPWSAEAGSGRPCPACCGWGDGSEQWGGEGLGPHSWPPGAEPPMAPEGHSGLARLLSEQPSSLVSANHPIWLYMILTASAFAFQLTHPRHPHGAWRAPGRFCNGVVAAGSLLVEKGPMSHLGFAYILEKFASTRLSRVSPFQS